MTQDVNQISKRILVADDDPVIRHLITTIVTRDGYKVIVANNGDEARRLLRHDGDFRGAIFDMMMPGLSGLELLRFMRTEPRLTRIPVMMITSEKNLTLMTELFAAGATAILPKPFSTIQLQTMLNMLIGQSQHRSAHHLPKPVMVHDNRVGIITHNR